MAEHEPDAGTPPPDETPRKRAGKKPTRKEEEARILFAIHLLERKHHKWQIKATLQRRYGVTARTCERYLSRARAAIIKRSRKSKERHRDEAFGFYESIQTDPEVDIRTKMWAQERIDTIIGLNTGRPDDGDDDDGPTVYREIRIVPPGTPPVDPSKPPGLIEVVEVEDEDEA